MLAALWVFFFFYDHVFYSVVLMHRRARRRCTRCCRITHTSLQTEASAIQGLCSMLQLLKITQKQKSHVIFSLLKAVISLISTFRVNHHPFIVS